MSIAAGYIVPHPPIAVPEIGKGEEGKIQATLNSFDCIAADIAQICPETVILASPHSILYQDYFHVSPGVHAHGDFSAFRTPGVSMDVEYDFDFTEQLDLTCSRINFPAGTIGERNKELDHGTMVPLYFLSKYYSDFKLVRIGLSGLSLDTHYRFGKIISDIADSLNRKCVFVASGDLAHCQKEDGPYGYRPEGPQYDNKLMEVLKSGNLNTLLEFNENLLSRSMECGHRSFCILAGAMSGKEVTVTPLSHEATFGVGYGFAICHTGSTPKKQPSEKPHTSDPYVELARKTIDTYIRTGEIFIPDKIIPEMEQTKAGAFVSIHEHGMLRGCIGTFLPTQDNLVSEIICNAISASTRDPRFSPVREDELPYLDINVDILSEPELVSSVSELDAKKYGVIVEHGRKRGLLLPDLEGVDTPSEQIRICKQKAGIHPGETDLTLYRFSVVRHI